MGRIAEALGPLAISRLKEPGLYHAGGVSGLAFRITPSGSRSWVLRAVVAGRRRDHGLGAYPGVSLAMARDLAQVARNKIRAGIDPIEEGRSARSKLKAERDILKKAAVGATRPSLVCLGEYCARRRKRVIA